MSLAILKSRAPSGMETLSVDVEVHLADGPTAIPPGQAPLQVCAQFAAFDPSCRLRRHVPRHAIARDPVIRQAGTGLFTQPCQTLGECLS
jgi:hypothetical protein